MFVYVWGCFHSVSLSSVDLMRRVGLQWVACMTLGDFVCATEKKSVHATVCELFFCVDHLSTSCAGCRVLPCNTSLQRFKPCISLYRWYRRFIYGFPAPALGVVGVIKPNVSLLERERPYDVVGSNTRMAMTVKLLMLRRNTGDSQL